MLSKNLTSYIPPAQFNLLYVGGRPSTREFRFKGTISNLFVGSTALTAENIEVFHRQSLVGNQIQLLSVGDSSVRYCYPNRRMFEDCYVDDFDNEDALPNDFK